MTAGSTHTHVRQRFSVRFTPGCLSPWRYLAPATTAGLPLRRRGLGAQPACFFAFFAAFCTEVITCCGVWDPSMIPSTPER